MSSDLSREGKMRQDYSMADRGSRYIEDLNRKIENRQMRSENFSRDFDRNCRYGYYI